MSRRTPPPGGRRAAGRVKRPPMNQLGTGFGCQTGKVTWPSRSAAKAALKRTVRGGAREMTAVYRCGLCGCWHVTSQEQYD